MIELTVGEKLYYIDKKNQIKECIVFKINKAGQIGIVFPDLKKYTFVSDELLFTKLFPEYGMALDRLNGDTIESAGEHIWKGHGSFANRNELSDVYEPPKFELYSNERSRDTFVTRKKSNSLNVEQIISEIFSPKKQNSQNNEYAYYENVNYRDIF